jgi:hypothetical protein
MHLTYLQKYLKTWKKCKNITWKFFCYHRYFAECIKKLLFNFEKTIKNTAIHYFKINFGFLHIFENISGFINPVIGNTYTLHGQCLTNKKKFKKSKKIIHENNLFSNKIEYHQTTLTYYFASLCCIILEVHQFEIQIQNKEAN